MILYHGTSQKNAKKILEDKCLKANVERLYKNINLEIANTTDGYVYLTTNLHTAYYYGNIGNRTDDQKEKYVYIFKFDIDESLLLPDYDEIETITDKNLRGTNVSAEESIKLCGAVTMDSDLSVANAFYMKLPCTMNFIESEEEVNLCCKLSKLQISKPKQESVMHDIYEKIEETFSWVQIESI